MRCFVTNCENTIGVPFPEDQELLNIWLKSLQITDRVPDVNSFVCFDHFDKNDIVDIVKDDGSHEKTVHSGAVPRFLSLEDVIEKETEEFLEFRNDKIGTRQDSPQIPDVPVESSGELTQSFEEESKDIPTKETNVVNAEHSVFEPQYQEFQEGQFILEADYSGSPSSSQSFPAFGQDAQQAPIKEDIIQEPNLVIGENQDFLTVQHEFTPPQVFPTEGQVYTSEGQQMQIYTSEGQSVFTTDGQQVFVSAGQPLLTQEGHQVFISEDEQQAIPTPEQAFEDEQKFTTGEDVQQVQEEDVHEAIPEEEMVVAEDRGETMISEEMNQMSEDAAITNEIVSPPFQGKIEEPDPEELSLDQKSMESGLEENSENYSEAIPQPVELPEQEAEERRHVAESSASAENIVMQWFVPNQPEVKSEQTANSADLLNTLEEEKKITITYHEPVSEPQQMVIPQSIMVEKEPPIPSPIKILKKERVEVNRAKEESCRLCMSNELVNVNILDNIKDNIMVLEAIQLCIHPLELSLEDPFSKMICIRCFNLLQKYFEFRQSCLEIDADQKRAYEKAHPQHRFLEKRKPIHQFSNYPKKTHMKTIISPSKMGYRQTEIVTVMGPNSRDHGMKNISRRVILTPTQKKKSQSEEVQYLLKDVNSGSVSGPSEKCVRQIISTVSKADDIQVYKLKKSPITNQNGQSYPLEYKTVQRTAAVPISLSPKKFKASHIEALARKPPLSTAKQLKIQEELKKVIEGTMSKDDLSVDHVIVRVVSDDEADEKIDHFPAKRKKFGSSFLTTIDPRHDFGRMKIGRSEVAIPKGIRVSIPEKFESSRGIFACFPKRGTFGTEFALIDGYLFEYRLCKGRERFLKCVSASCTAIASQKLLDTGKYENRALVKIAHNHHQLTSTEVKKQMFYYVMKKKMQVDKGLNFRSLYDQICDKDPEIKTLVPLRNLINEICKHQLTQKPPQIKSFDDFYNLIEDDSLQKFQFTYLGKQFYQERFMIKEEGTKAVIFANVETIKKVSHSKLMYVDASFRIETGENFSYQLVTVLVWIDDSYYPIMFALVSHRTMEIFKKVFSYLHDTLAPKLCPEEIVTDYEANIYYALGETYLESHIGGSVFYYTQNLYKKICELGLSRELETTAYFKNMYHMLLMLPLLPVNTIMDGLQNIEIQANDLGVGEITAGLFEHIKEQWMEKVTPDLFCVHRLENRINENVIAPFKKLRDFLMLSKGKTQHQSLSILNVVEKLIDLENFLQTTYSSDNKKSFGRDLSSSQKKNVLKAWLYIETHPKININHFFTKVIGYIKCMENQLWIWGYYKFSGKVTDDLINAANFSIVNTNETEMEVAEEEECTIEEEPNFVYTEDSKNTVVVEAVVGPSGEFVISDPESSQGVESSIFNYVYKE